MYSAHFSNKFLLFPCMCKAWKGEDSTNMTVSRPSQEFSLREEIMTCTQTILLSDRRERMWTWQCEKYRLNAIQG